MKRRIAINVNGEAYPCYQTAGAMLRFKDLTGDEISRLKGTDISGMIKFLWCCVVSACCREKMEFPLTLMEFADSIGPDELKEWQDAIQEGSAEVADDVEGQKKSPSA
ncbi:MAG: hypothetical protein K2G69_09040 [Muribaculaceae bacterium]|nr:hypothetical protein [Muribaculaceae bacterium]